MLDTSSCVRCLTLLTRGREGQREVQIERRLCVRVHGLGKYLRDWTILGCLEPEPLDGLYSDPILEGFHCSTRRCRKRLAVFGSVRKTWLD
jgi:hypothetical protein